ncbi:MAG: hypothetical protein ACXWDO_09340 [Bacteroidia bacterium]
MRKLIILAVLVYTITAFFSDGYHHPDEQFQILEFAALKWGANTPQDLAWEYHEQMRPAFQPAIVVAVYNILNIFTEPNPFTIILLLRLLSAAIALGSILLFINTFKSYFTTEKLQRWFIVLSLFMWFSVYVNVRFSSEGWSGSFFLIALSLLARENRQKWHVYFIAGLCFGISFLCRYQVAFLMAGLGLWLLFIKRENWKNIALIIPSFLLVFAAGILIDYWFYGEWVLTAWKYFEINIVKDAASTFGVHPFWHYVTQTFEKAAPPFSLVYIFGVIAFIFLKPKSVITWSVVPFLLIHHITPHKELRFLFPMVNLVPFMLISVVQVLPGKSGGMAKFINTRTAKILAGIFWLMNICILAVIMFKPSDTTVRIYRFIYNNYKEPTHLYYTHNDPYSQALYIRYYKRPNLTTQRISSVENIPLNAGTTQLVILKSKDEIVNCKCQYKLVYSTFPEWAEAFNFNDWQARSNVVFIYEIEK